MIFFYKKENHFMKIESYQITKKDFFVLYNMLVVDYLSSTLSYDTCAENAFKYLEVIENYLPTDKPFRLIHPLYEFEANYNFYVDYQNKKIFYEGIISVKALFQMRVSDLYISSTELDDICDKYYLERKAERKIKIEKLLKNG